MTIRGRMVDVDGVVVMPPHPHGWSLQSGTWASPATACRLLSTGLRMSRRRFGAVGEPWSGPGRVPWTSYWRTRLKPSPCRFGESQVGSAGCGATSDRSWINGGGL